MKYTCPVIKSSGIVKMFILISVCTGMFAGNAAAQEEKQVVRIARLQIDSTWLEKYTAMLKEQMEAAIRLEPGVLSYYAMADKTRPHHITILETYASPGAYKAHLETPHFKKYKTGTQGMVLSLELIDVVPIAVVKKKN